MFLSSHTMLRTCRVRSVLGGARLGRRPAAAAARRPAGLKVTNIDAWLTAHADSFAPPVMNKLMHRDQLSIMFVGGPNRREDFHLEEGSEFFYQLRGDMELPTVQAGARVAVAIREGDVFLLPSRIPHSPQRPAAGSIGLVVERRREESEPPDGLRYYVDFHTCDRVLWERYFHCYDLGRDLAPVVAAFEASPEKASRVPSAESVLAEPPLVQDTTTHVPPPFNLEAWLAARADALDAGAALNLFEGHPDREFSVVVHGGPADTAARWEHETWLYQLRGEATVSVGAERATLTDGDSLVVPAGREYRVSRTPGSRGLVVTNDPTGNKPHAR